MKVFSDKRLARVEISKIECGGVFTDQHGTYWMKLDAGYARLCDGKYLCKSLTPTQFCRPSDGGFVEGYREDTQ